MPFIPSKHIQGEYWVFTKISLISILSPLWINSKVTQTRPVMIILPFSICRYKPTTTCSCLGVSPLPFAGVVVGAWCSGLCDIRWVTRMPWDECNVSLVLRSRLSEPNQGRAGQCQMLMGMGWGGGGSVLLRRPDPNSIF